MRTGETAEQHQWRHEHGEQLGEQLRLQYGPLTPDELSWVWAGVCQSIAIDNGLDRERLDLLVVAARLKAKKHGGGAG